MLEDAPIIKRPTPKLYCCLYKACTCPQKPRNEFLVPESTQAYNPSIPRILPNDIQKRVCKHRRTCRQEEKLLKIKPKFFVTKTNVYHEKTTATFSAIKILLAYAQMIGRVCGCSKSFLPFRLIKKKGSQPINRESLWHSRFPSQINTAG